MDISNGMNDKRRIIVSVGGSLIVPDEIDTQFLSNFRVLISEKIAQGLSFYIITGGGKIARRWRDAVGAVSSGASMDDLDRVGIAATRLNAELVRSLFLGVNVPPIIMDMRIPATSESPVIVAGGLSPGWSTDYCSVLAAKTVGAKKMVNLSNIDYVYTADPRKNPDAERIEKTSWADFRKLIPEKWDPGLSTPFDPIAAAEAQTQGLEVAVINGAHLDRFSDYLDGKPFVGTIIS